MLQQVGKNLSFNSTAKISFVELKLTNDLQLANDVAAIQYDELELKLQGRVGSLAAQLKETNNKCNMLRSEVFSLKQRLANNDADEVEMERLCGFCFYSIFFFFF